MIFTTEQGKYLTEDEEALKFIKSELINWSGAVEVLIRKPKRSQKQNRAIHSLFTDLAVELNGLGITFDVGNFKAEFTPETAKEFFVLCFLGGKRT